jgi:glucuronyl/N-acetylglucosaminyl transferase EXT2
MRRQHIVEDRRTTLSDNHHPTGTGAAISVGLGSLIIQGSQSTTRQLRRRRRKEEGTPSLFAGVSRKTIMFFSVVGLVCCVGVHLYLLQVFMTVGRRSLIVPSTPSLPLRRELTPLRDIDREQYTIRINTWQRLDQLRVSIHHHASCPGVAAIQVVWCNAQGEPPDFLYENGLVHVERHGINTLNERFHIIDDPPTRGILSMDDDVLRPCEAIDAGFFKWVQNPHRMVGFDARSHVVSESTGKWSYAYMSTTETTNQYSLTLPRYAFLHRDYFDRYMTELPPTIFQTVAKNFNCEDIAMSLFVSSLSNAKPPLLADFWAIKSMVKLYSPDKISGSRDHKALRDECVDSFAELLGLKETFHTTQLVHDKHAMFECGSDDAATSEATVDRQVALRDKVNGWKSTSSKNVQKQVGKMKTAIMKEAFSMGLLEHTEPWTARWKKKD